MSVGRLRFPTLQRLRRFHDDYFPGVEDRAQRLVQDGQHPSILFIGCRS